MAGKILILGGTGEARELAGRLAQLGFDVTTSLAGRTSEVAPIAGQVRSGGFGGADRLADYLKAENIQYLVDATHPFAVQISANAVVAAASANLPLLRLTRPAWQMPEGADWHCVQNIADAATDLPDEARVLLTTGHRDLDYFVARPSCHFFVRLIEVPQQALPDNFELILQRPPYTLGGEIDLMRAKAITHLITKNAGGAQTAAKLSAAQQLDIRVVMIDRPILPDTPESSSIDATVNLLQTALS